VGKKKNKAFTAEESARLTGLLGDPSALEPDKIRETLSGPAMAEAFVERLPATDAGIIPLITAIRDAFPDKNVQKAVRRKGYMLEQRGFTVPTPAEDGETGILRKIPLEVESYAYVTSVDAFGMQMLFYALPRAPRGYELGVVAVSDEEGLYQFESAHVSKKMAMDVLGEFKKDFNPHVETTIDHVLLLLEEARRASEKAPGVRPYLQARHWLMSRASLPETHPVYELIPEENIQGMVLTEGMASKLLDHELLQRWMLDPRDVQPIADEIDEVRNSPLHLSEDQVSRRIDDILKDRMQEYFTESRRRIYRRRLEETAYVLHRMGEPDVARRALCAARSMEEKDNLFHANPFLAQLMVNTVDMILEGMEDDEEEMGGEEDGTSSGLILPK